jgi:small-conductance mechanosensitive channel
MQDLEKYTTLFIHSLGIDSSFVLWGNTLFDYIFALLIFIFGSALFYLAQKFGFSLLQNIAERTKTDYDDIFVKILRSFRPQLFFLLSFYFALQYLTISGIPEKILSALVVLYIVYQLVIITGILVEDVLFKHFAKEKDPTTKSALRLISNLARGLMWVFGFLFILSNFGIDVTALMAGAGIAGIAIAFALQGVLGDLFSAFSLYFDKPFKVGNFIVTGDTAGTVQHIGLKSTRIKALSGEMIVLSNKELSATKIQNFKEMQERRIVFSFGVLYHTNIETLENIPKKIEKIISSLPQTRFDRAHFKAFGASSLDFEVVYFILSSDYGLYMDIQEKINLSLMKAFRENGVSFAYPTQTIYLEK